MLSKLFNRTKEQPIVNECECADCGKTVPIKLASYLHKFICGNCVYKPEYLNNNLQAATERVEVLYERLH